MSKERGQARGPVAVARGENPVRAPWTGSTRQRVVGGVESAARHTQSPLRIAAGSGRRRRRRLVISPCPYGHGFRPRPGGDLTPAPDARQTKGGAVGTSGHPRRVTTGLKWAPDTDPKARIRATRPAAVAVEFSSSWRPTSPRGQPLGEDARADDERP